MIRTGTAMLLAIVLGCTAAHLGHAARGPTYHVVYSFQGGSDGTAPFASVINVGGTLYGTTYNGGAGCPAPGCGTVRRPPRSTAIASDVPQCLRRGFDKSVS